MRPRQARCAQQSGAENLKANHSTQEPVQEKKKKKKEENERGKEDFQVLQRHHTGQFFETTMKGCFLSSNSRRP